MFGFANWLLSCIKKEHFNVFRLLWWKVIFAKYVPVFVKTCASLCFGGGFFIE
jgi:hypothetical protein